MRGRLRFLTALLMGFALVAGACGSDDEEAAPAATTATTAAPAATTAAAAPDDDGPLFIYLPPTPIGSNPFLELGDKGTREAAERLGGEYKIFESTDSNSRRANLEAAVAENPDIIVMTTFDFIDLSAEFAAANPDQEFILIDACPGAPTANLHCGVFREQEAGYLLGIMAGSLSETGNVGSVVALDIPFLHRYSDSFALGAQSVNPDATDAQVFIGGDNPFVDPARAKEQSLSLVAQGVDHIFAVGAGSNGGVFEAALENGVFAYGVDINECLTAPGAVVDNSLKLVDVVVNQLIDAVMAGTAESVVSYGLADGGTGVIALQPDVADSQCLIADYPDIIAAVQAAQDDIISGAIVVPDPLFAPVVETAAPAADGPASLSIATIHLQIADDPWNSTVIDAIERAKAAKPHGLDITRETFENIDYADGERVLRELAASGKYQMIVAHSTFGDAVSALMGDFPDIAWVYSGSGNQPLGGNAFWIDVMLHEPGYVAGVVAGMMSETNMIGGVAAFPYPNVAGPMNAFFDGARSVNPDIETNVTYIESWFDPAGAREAGEALIAAGADSLYAASAFGTFEAIGEGERVFAVGDFANLEAFYPNVMITSLLALWDPGINDVIDAWWDYTANGVPYDAPMERILYSMADGGSDIAPMNEALVPADVAAAAADVRNQILSGELVVELRTDPGGNTEAAAASDGPASLRVAFIYDGTIDQGGWNGAMDRGRQYLEEQMPSIEVISVEGISPGQAAQRAMSDLADDGYNVIVGTSTFDADMVIVAPEFPDTNFYQACDATVSENMGQFCIAVEEAAFVNGAFAATLSETGEIGYVAAFPIFFVLKPLNMFVAGARSVNPDANVSVVFTNSWFDPGLELQAANALLDSGADVLTYDLSSPTVPEVAEQRGAHFVGYGYDDARTQAPDSWAGGAIYNWGPLFVEAIQEMQAGTWVPGYVYGGYSDGWLDIADFGDDVSQETRQATTDLIAEISTGNVDVFAGPLVDADGNVIVPEGEALDPYSRAICCEWTIEGVTG